MTYQGMDAMVTFLPSPDVAGGSDRAASLVSRHGHRTVVRLDGEHDIATVPGLVDTLARAIAVDDADLIVDLSGVTFIDAATIGVLIGGRNLLRPQARALTLRSPSGRTRRVLDLCGLAGLVEPR